MSDRHIVPFGGLRPRAPETHPIIEFILDLTGKDRPKVAILAQATGDSSESVLRLVKRFPPARAEVTHVDLFNRVVVDLRSTLLDQDVIIVGGGNTANMLAVWRVHGVDAVLRHAWESGIVLCGGSAGSLAWFEGGTTDSFDLNKLAPINDGLGFLPGTHCPHYDGEEQRRPLYHQLIRDGFPAGIAIDEDAAVHFVGTTIREVVSARFGATAYRVEATDGRVVETAYEARALPGSLGG